MANLKIKALLQKLVEIVKDTNKIGMAAELYGKNSAGTGDYSLTTTFTNPLPNQSSCRVYNASGEWTSATTTAQQNDLFVITPSAGTIKVLEDGRYLIAASAYAYSGFTAGDRFQFRIQINTSTPGRLYRRERMSANYQIIYLTQSYNLKANDTLSIVVSNYEGARGKVVTTGSTMLQLVRIG